MPICSPNIGWMTRTRAAWVHHGTYGIIWPYIVYAIHVEFKLRLWNNVEIQPMTWRMYCQHLPTMPLQNDGYGGQGIHSSALDLMAAEGLYHEVDGLREPGFITVQTCSNHGTRLVGVMFFHQIQVGFTYGQEGLLKPCLALFLLHVAGRGAVCLGKTTWKCQWKGTTLQESWNPLVQTRSFHHCTHWNGLFEVGIGIPRFGVDPRLDVLTI